MLAGLESLQLSASIGQVIFAHVQPPEEEEVGQVRFS